jgi:addiction module RelB/DinJ family antitoxin
MAAQINVKLDPKFKKDVEKLSDSLGLNSSDVVRVMLKKFVDTRGFPFPVVKEEEFNEETKRAMRRVKAGIGLHYIGNTIEEFDKYMKGD